MKQNKNTKSKTQSPKGASHDRKDTIVNHKPIIALRRTDWYAILFIIIISITLYGNTYYNNYALDDLITIQQNSFTHQGFKGIHDILTNDYFTGAFGKDIKHLPGARYRPLSVITFAIEYQYFGMNPHVSHLINILLYTLTGIFVYFVITSLLSEFPEHKTQNINFKSNWYLSAPFIASVLFVAHPVHTEIVSNIKGRDEIFAFLGSLIAFYYSLKYIDQKTQRYSQNKLFKGAKENVSAGSKLKTNNLFLVFSFLAMFLALMSKENAICFILIIPLAIYFFRKVSIKSDFIVAIPLILAGIIFLGIRQIIVGSQVSGTEIELMNNPFLNATISQKYATIVYTLGLYLKLLIFPHPLTYDYYPYYIPLVNWNDIRVIISLLINLVLITFSILGIINVIRYKNQTTQNSISRTNNSIITFCILLYFIPLLLTSNLFFTIGVFMSERFIYMSSLGFCLGVGYLVYRLVLKLSGSDLKLQESKSINNYSHYAINISLIIVLLLFSYKTIDRNKAWKDSLTLYLTDVKTSYNSAKSNYDAANTLAQTADTLKDISLKNHYYDLSIKYALKAYKIHPVYADNLLTLGNVYYLYKKNFDSVMYYYKKQLQGFPDDNRPCNNISHFFYNYDDADFKIKAYKELLNLRPDNFDLNNNLGYLFGKYKNNLDSGIYFLSRAELIYNKNLDNNPNICDTYNNLGTWLYLKHDLLKAKDYYIKAINIKPDNTLFQNNMAIVERELQNVH